MSAKYSELASQLKKLIKTNLEKNPAEPFRLPTESALCQTYNVSRQTVRKALSVLEEERLIQKRQGSGSYAVDNRSRNGANQIAILVQSNTEYIYPRLLADLCGTLQKNGYAWTVYVTDCQLSREREILEFLLKNPVRGILSEGCQTSSPTPNDDLYRRLAQQGTSILFFCGEYSNLMEFPSVKDANYDGGYQLGRYLISLGHRKIGGIFRTDEIQGVEQRLGLLSALRDAQLLCCEKYICPYGARQLTALHRHQDTRFLSEFLDTQLADATAVVCCNDEIAYWLIKELARRNMRVPDDISIVCFGSSYLADLSSLQISCLSHELPQKTTAHEKRVYEMGTAAAETLLKQLRGTPVSSQLLPWYLVTRQSSTSPPT